MVWDSRSRSNVSIVVSNVVIHFVKNFFVFFQLCYQIVPASLYVCVEIACAMVSTPT